MYVLLIAAAGGAALLYVLIPRGNGPEYIGVMLPLSGPDDVGWRQPLDWALGAINKSGGVNGRRLALRYIDIAKENPMAAAERLAQDDSVLAVIGPDKSSVLFEVAPVFLAAKKPLVSPSSTSGDVTRAFAGSRFIWRTTESDIGQLRAMFLQASERQVSNVALVTTLDPYGSTFFDWFGFFATELGMHVTDIQRLDAGEDCTQAVSQAIATHPQLIIAAPSERQTAVCIAREMQGQSGVDLLFSDGGMFPDLIQELGPAAEGLEGMTLAPDPASGFTEAYREKFGSPPVAYAANTYDALLLLAYGLERSGGEGGDSLADALIELTGATGTPTAWDQAGIASALAMIRDGGLPDIQGATGDLDFGDKDQIDLVASYYALWRVEDGAFRLGDVVSTDPKAHGQSAAAEALFREQGSAPSASQASGGATTPALEARTGLWALIVAGSSGWENYRHQADALAQYQLLRSAGVPDDHIILILADDIANAPENPEPGVVRHEVGGPDLYENVEVDYKLVDVSAADILDILAGKRSDRLPYVLETTPGDDVYVFMSGHGSGQGFFVGVDRAADRVAAESVLSPESLAGAIARMQVEGRYRRLLVAVEMCQAGAMGKPLTAPDALLIGGANAYENSLATNYAPDLGAWLGDEFAVAFTQFATSDATATLEQTYQDVYLDVPGSHVSVYNAANFGSLDDVSLLEFVSP